MAGRSSKGKMRGSLSDKVRCLDGATVSRASKALLAEQEANCSDISFKVHTVAMGLQVRVWWPPTKDKHKTDFSGMYWPAKVVKFTSGDEVMVQYDNGDKETVLSENVSPFNPPFKFGDEGCPLQVRQHVFAGSYGCSAAQHDLSFCISWSNCGVDLVARHPGSLLAVCFDAHASVRSLPQVGEFCEVFNNSKSDPAAWVGKVKKVNKKDVTVSHKCQGNTACLHWNLVLLAHPQAADAQPCPFHCRSPILFMMHQTTTSR